MRFFTFFLTTALTFTPVFADGKSLNPGDHGFKHEELHEDYQKFYQQYFDANKCHCASGECRPTQYRDSMKSESGIEVMFDGVWVAVPKKALIEVPWKKVPKKMLAHSAHACGRELLDDQGRPSGKFYIECVILIQTS